MGKKYALYVNDARAVTSATNPEGLRSGYLAPKVGGGWELAFYARHAYTFDSIAQVMEAMVEHGIGAVIGVHPGHLTGYAASPAGLLANGEG